MGGEAVWAAAAPGNIIFVRAGANGTNTGVDWPNAYVDLHDALAEAATLASPTSPVEIWVGEGTYHADRGTGDRLMWYEVPAYTELYGGFVGNEVVRSQRDWHAHPTILDGDILGNDAPDFVPESNCCLIHAAPGCDDVVCQAKVVALDTRCDNPHPFADVWSGQCVDYAMQQCCDICRPSRCDNSYRILDVSNGDGVIIDGFTIRNGEASNYYGEH